MRAAIIEAAFLALFMVCMPGFAELPRLVSKAQLARSQDMPTEVAVDSQGRFYVLYGQKAYLDILDEKGNRLERRGDTAEESSGPTRLTPVSQWVGRLAHSLLLATEPSDKVLSWVLVPAEHRLKAIHLKGAPLELDGRGAVARDLDGRLFVYHQDTHTVYVFGGSTGSYQNRIKLAGDPIAASQFAVDSRHQFYLLGQDGLTVFSFGGERAYNVPGVTQFYLTGTDRLVAAGSDWVRRFSPDGGLQQDYPPPPEAAGMWPAAISINDKAYIYVYYRDGVDGHGVTVKLDPRGIPVASWDQPRRFPATPDPGFRLDYLGRLHMWDSQQTRLVLITPEGKVERSLSYSPAPDPTGFMGGPTDMALAPDQTLWLADPGNFRLQRFRADKGWLSPIPVGIRDGPARAHPRQLAVTPTGHILSIVHPPGGRGMVYLHRRDGEGRLLSQKPICQGAGEPNVKVAVSPDGSIFVYRLGGRPANTDFLEHPQLEKFTARGDLLARVGGEARNFHLPNKFLSQIALAPQEDMLPFRGGLILPNAAKLLVVDDQLAVTQERGVKLPYGLVEPIFGGGTMVGETLVVTDMANRCIHKIPLQGL